MDEVVAARETAFRDTEIGPIPAEWRLVSVGRVGEVITGRTPSTKEERYWGGSVPFITPVDLLGGPIQKAARTISREGLEVCRALPRGTVVVSCIGYIGKTGVVDSSVAATNQQINAVIVDEQIADNWYLTYALTHLEPVLNTRARMTTVPILNKTNFQKVPIPFPSLPEQRAIAHILSTIQSAIAAQDRVIAAARELKRSLMARLFRYGPGRGPAETKETEFGPVPQHWGIKLLRECALVQTGVAKGRKFGSAKTITLPYLRVANVQDGYLDLSEIKSIQIKESERERYSLQHGDVVLTEGGDFDKLGRGFIWKGQIPNCVHQNHIFAVRTDKKILLPEYLAYLAQSDYGKAYFLKLAHRTTNLASINSTKLKALPVLIPSLGEQEQIAEMLSSMDCKIAVEEQRKAALEALFGSMLEQLMTGRIRVRG